MLDVDRRIEITKLMQDQFTDMDIIREKPIVFDNSESNILLIVKPVLFKEHDKFLQDMARIIIENYEVFKDINFLSINNYDKEEDISELINKVNIFTASKEYKKFKKQSMKFIEKWAFVSRRKNLIELSHNKNLCKKYIEGTDPSEFIHILFTLFVMNFDIVKKNLMEFLKVFRINLNINSNSQMDISSRGISRKAVVMPNYSPKPFNESTLNLLEQQSKM